MTGDAPKSLATPVPAAPDSDTDEGTDRAAVVTPHPDRADDVAPDRLDASAHAHLLEEPLPPDAATETAIIYNVTLSAPHLVEDSPPEPSVSDAPRTTTVQRRSAVARGGPGSGRPSSAGAGTGVATDADERAAASSSASSPGDDPADDDGRVAAEPSTVDRVPTARKVGAVTAVALVAALAGLSGYLWISATEWRDRAGSYQRTAGDLGDDLATTRNQLAGSQAELEAVRAQLSTAHARIVELADEKNQALDDWELTQQLVDYQQRISEAAGNVALALDQCVQGQQELIGYLEQQAQPGPSTPPYDPAQLAAFETQVEALCQEASEANIGLQLALAQ
ncbi:hypothetical protein N867_10680 [Actinotalea fermentans ATCC 43279 = JCM 9966 = DSM 3133]|uniref:Uncharacterized protein n=1 Tax=Actinotalea fermentans TaxID=43671 RepID=A0A511YVI1_9CELL|nr:hypothetical protein N867_10680 [Actinotalea fermentans ATCC 43279 = JCM 9966 = DSM 3133]GEN79211.1 hypothetical protein AFE02nite_09450 [Actinotalea fermentans]